MGSARGSVGVERGLIPRLFGTLASCRPLVALSCSAVPRSVCIEHLFYGVGNVYEPYLPVGTFHLCNYRTVVGARCSLELIALLCLRALLQAENRSDSRALLQNGGVPVDES